MAEQLIVPKLGMAAAVVTLTEWKANEGARIEKGDAVLDIEAEKSTFEMTAPVSGYLHILYPQGAEADVSTVVGVIAETEEEYASFGGGGNAPAPKAETAATPTAAEPAPAARTGGKMFISPLARRMAKEHGIDYAALTGSGPNGRIQRQDIDAAIAARQSGQVPGQRSQPAAPPVSSAPFDPAGRTLKETIPYRGMRKVIGENMLRSLAINAPNTMSGDYDLTVMAKYRDNFIAHESRLGTRITYADIMIWAVSRALRQFPLMNSSLIENEIRVWDAVNVGMAVALGEHGEKGLVVPVIKNADKLSLVEISKETKRLGARARAEQLIPDEMSGGTFTVSNFGSLGVSSYSTPIINSPESGILGIGRLQKKPIVRNDGIVIAPMLPYSLTHDHRVTDGAAAEYFLGILKKLAENTSAELSELILF
ncbi:MAG TPA: dihydrolipoamide acetyltransferase family protein [Novosphingobium sp.]|nr:dihydrolipoamide acetyltransferase family protein [Novosphingobium sp.]